MGESKEAAERLRGDAERAFNRGDDEREKEAREMADKAEDSAPDRARDIEREHNRGGAENERAGDRGDGTGGRDGF